MGITFLVQFYEGILYNDDNMVYCIVFSVWAIVAWSLLWMQDNYAS